MTSSMSILIFARHDSQRLPGKALRHVGGMPLLERVIRRARLTPWTPYLATTDKPSDDPLVALAQDLGIHSYRGSECNVLERGVLAAEAFGLETFIRLCGDRPLFPIPDMLDAGRTMVASSQQADGIIKPDLVTTWPITGAPPGLTTEVIRTRSLRKIMERGLNAGYQEHMTQYFYHHPNEFNIIHLRTRRTQYNCPGFALDTMSDLHNLNRIFSVYSAIDLSPDEADRIYTR